MSERLVSDLSSDVPAAVGRRHFLSLVAAGLAAAGLPVVWPHEASAARTAGPAPVSGGDIGDNFSRRYGIEEPPVVLDQDPARVLLDQNENQLGPGPTARQAMVEALDVANRYPDAEGRLIERLASYHGVPEACLLPGCGSTELLKICADATTGPGHDLVQGFPTYATIDRYTQVNGGGLIEVPCDGQGRLDLEGMLARITPRTGCVFFCNPNNPTGGVHGEAAARAFVDRVPESVLVVVDEAYHDYVEDPAYGSLVPSALERPNVIVLRTFSKVFGLAGMRIGYGIAHRETIRRLAPWRLTLDLNNPAIFAALAALDDRAFYSESVRVNAASRARLLREVPRSGIRAYPSQTGFVWYDFGRPTEPVRRALAERHVYVRTYRHSPDHLRISTGTAADMDRLMAALDEVMR